MEKRKAHYDLMVIKAQVQARGLSAFTRLAIRGADLMGLSGEQMLAIVAALQPAMLYKSMTTHVDVSLWQDVYHAPCPNGKTAYIKLTLQQGAVVIQFKEK